MKNLLVIISITFFLSNSSFAQEQENVKAMFLEAESYFLFQEYSEAINLYLKLKAVFPESQNILYKIGVCYLNDPFNREKAIYYLEQAVTNVSDKYKDSNIKEIHAPLDAIYYLGDAYRVNNRLDEAIETYEEFLSIVNHEIYDTELVKDQIQACYNAKQSKLKHSTVDVYNLGELINDAFSQTNPVISGDAKSMVYVSKLKFYDAIFYSTLKNDTWSAPRNIIPELQIDGDAYPTSLNFDGTKMYLYRNDKYDGNIWVSSLRNGFWTPPVKLNENINTKYWESFASVSQNDKTLFFTSNRPGGYGDLDIYMSKINATGDWGIPINLGPTINTKYNEEEPIITADGKRLYFISYGHQTNGGYDIFFSELEDNIIWKKPTNIGFPINTTDDDRHFYPYNNGEFALISSIDPRGHGKYDINKLEIFTYRKPVPINILTQLKKTDGTENLTERLSLKIYNKRSNELVLSQNIYANDSLTANLTSGEYEISIDGKKYSALKHGLHVESNNSNQLTINDTLKNLYQISINKEIKREIAVIPLSRSVYNINENELVLPIKITPNSTVDITVYNKKTIIQQSNKYIPDSLYNFILKPKEGVNKVVIRVTNNGAEKTVSVKINYSKPKETPIADEHKKYNDSVKISFIDQLLLLADDKLDSIIQSNRKLLEQADNIDAIYATLKDLSINAGYDSDVIDLLFASTIKNSIANYYNTLFNQSLDSNSFADTNQILILKNNRLQVTTTSSISELISFIIHLAEKNNITTTDISLWASDNLSTSELNFINKILSNEHDIKQALIDIIEIAGKSVEYKTLLEKLVDYILLKDLVQQLKLNSTTTLSSIFDTLNVEKNKIYTIDDFVNYLHKLYKEQVITYEEMIEVFSKIDLLVNQRNIPIEITAQTTSNSNWKLIYWGAPAILILILAYRKYRKKSINNQNNA